MIAKNEEQHLSRCLHSIQGLVSEIILIDTGSTDYTKKVAQDFGAKVYEQPWKDDFSAARNMSIEKASNPWVLVLDADEHLTHHDPQELEVILSNHSGLAFVHIRNLFSRNGEQFEEDSQIIRLFTREHYRYIGRIHEQLSPVSSDLLATPHFSGIELFHDGYSDEHVMRTAKFERNLRILLEELENNQENSAYLHYQIGKTYFVHQDYQSAKASFDSAILQSSQLPRRLVHSLALDYGYVLKELTLLDHAISHVSRSLEIFSDSCDLWFLMALLLTQRGFKSDIDFVMRCYKHCLEIGDSKKYDSIRGTGSFLAANNLALLLQLLGDHRLAGDFFRHADHLKKANT